MVFDKGGRLFPQDQALTHCRVSMKFDKSESPFRPDQFIFYLTVTKSDLNKNIGKFQRVTGIRHWINQNNRSAVQSESSLSRVNFPVSETFRCNTLGNTLKTA